MYRFLFLMTVLVAVLASEEKYSDKYDHFNVEEILHNDRLLENYYKCLMDTGPCTAEGNALKIGAYMTEVIPEALTNECAKCTEIQKEVTEKVIKFLSEKQQEMWRELEKKYDPEEMYKKKYGEMAHKHGIEM